MTHDGKFVAQFRVPLRTRAERGGDGQSHNKPRPIRIIPITDAIRQRARHRTPTK
jgi:hypothetical protein